MPKRIRGEAEAQKEYMRQWRLENAERLREYNREYDKKKRAGRVRNEEQKKRDRECNRKARKTAGPTIPYSERSRAPQPPTA